jgi:hypothetical protein
MSDRESLFASRELSLATELDRIQKRHARLLYVLHRIERAGWNDPVFPRTALRGVAAAARDAIVEDRK